ncbi:MAG: STAS domain-containing protein [Acidobacteriota bacterium]
MIIDKQRLDRFVLLKVEGIIKLGQSAEFLAQSLERTLERDEGDVLLDLSAINYIDSTGIGELVGYLSRFGERDRRLILVAPSERILKLLDIAQIASLFRIFDDLDAALAADGGRASETIEGPSTASDRETA